MSPRTNVDRRLEDFQGTQAAEWIGSSEAPLPLPSPASIQSRDACDKYRRRFTALKRRFYFEHVDGGDGVFALDLGSHARFHEMLRTPADDPDHLSLLIAAINRSYCPQSFEEAKDKLYLWIGHRLDEQPTKSFLSGEYIPLDRLSIRRPRPPGTLNDRLAYVPDHLLLSVAGIPHSDSLPVALRVDAALFRTLWTMLHGLPRHLINPGELNRLDAFLDRLTRMEPSRWPEFLVHNTEYVTSSAVKMSNSVGAYREVRQL